MDSLQILHLLLNLVYFLLNKNIERYPTVILFNDEENDYAFYKDDEFKDLRNIFDFISLFQLSAVTTVNGKTFPKIFATRVKVDLL